MELEEYVTNDERKAQIIELIDVIIEKIASTDKYITGSNLYEMRRRAMHIISENGKMEFTDSEEFEKTVNSSGWESASGIAKVKDSYQHSFKLLKMLVNGEMHTKASSPETYWNY